MQRHLVVFKKSHFAGFLGPSGLFYANFEFLGYNLYTKRRFNIIIEAKNELCGEILSTKSGFG